MGGGPALPGEGRPGPGTGGLLPAGLLGAGNLPAGLLGAGNLPPEGGIGALTLPSRFPADFSFGIPP